MKNLWRIAAILAVLALLVGTMGAAAARPNRQEDGSTRPADVALAVFIDYRSSGSVSPENGFTDSNPSFKTHADAKWPSLPVLYDINSSGAPSGFSTNVQNGFNTWETTPSPNIDIFGTVDSTSACGPSFDGDNTVCYASIDGAGGIIAETFVWFDMRNKEVLEFDMKFDSDEGSFWTTSKIQEIATHESGHTLFLDDLHQLFAWKLTMFYADTSANQSTLGLGDCLGVVELYGTATTTCPSPPND